MNHKLIPVKSEKDIPQEYRNNPIGNLFQYHNLGKKFGIYKKAVLLIGMCMDNRKHLHIPDNFAFIIRTGGANLRYSEFKVSFAIGVGKVGHIALIGHNHCGMVKLMSKRKEFVDGLVKTAGWTKQAAEEHFMNLAPMHEIGDAAEFIVSETLRMREKYPAITIAPLFYKVEDRKLYLIKI